VVLEDDKHAFPPYEVAPLVRTQVLGKHSEPEQVLNLLAGRIRTGEMQKMNYRVAIDKEEPETVAREFLEAEGLI